VETDGPLASKISITAAGQEQRATDQILRAIRKGSDSSAKGISQEHQRYGSGTG